MLRAARWNWESELGQDSLLLEALVVPAPGNLAILVHQNNASIKIQRPLFCDAQCNYFEILLSWCRPQVRVTGKQ